MKAIYKFITICFAIGLLSACEEEIAKNSGVTDPVADPTKAPTGVTTGNVIDNLGTAVILSSSVGGEGEAPLLDNGVIVNAKSDFNLGTAGTVIAAADAAATGSCQVRAAGLLKNTTYYYRAYAMNAYGITYGDVKSFQTLNVTFTPYRTAFDPTKAADIADWKFDKYTGFDPEGIDLVWFSKDAGTTGVSCYWDGEDMTLVSPLLRIASAADVLGFYFYAGGYGSATTKVKVFITENLSNLGTPVKDWSFAYTSARTSIPMSPYFEKSVYIVIRIEAGDFILYNFSVAP